MTGRSTFWQGKGRVSPPTLCMLRARHLVLLPTATAHSQVKVASVMVSEDVVEQGVQNHGAVEMVHDAATKSRTGVFNVDDHGREGP